MLEIRNFAENETERKFLLKQLVTRSAVLPSWPKSNLPVFPVAPVWPKSNLPVFPAAHLSKASENLTSLNKTAPVSKAGQNFYKIKGLCFLSLGQHFGQITFG